MKPKHPLLLRHIRARPRSALAIVAKLSIVRDLAPAVRDGHILLTAVTIVMSWLFTHLRFALHYAHDYYLNESRGQPCGLDFRATASPTTVTFCTLPWSSATRLRPPM